MRRTLFFLNQIVDLICAIGPIFQRLSATGRHSLRQRYREAGVAINRFAGTVAGQELEEVLE